MALAYEVGQQLIVREDLNRWDDYKNFDGTSRISAVNNMFDLCGEVVTIEKIVDDAYGGCYKVKEDTGNWNWTDEMFYPPFKNEDELFAQLVNGNIKEDTYIKLLNKLTN